MRGAARGATGAGRAAGMAPAVAAPAGAARRAVGGVAARAAGAGAVAVPAVDAAGGDAGAAELRVRTAGANANGLVHRSLVAALRNRRQGSASTLTRGEVRGGGKKPYAQKGTGSARRGSRVSPLLPGGGVIFGPKPRDYSIKMNRKERRLALSSALHSAAEAGDVTVVPDLAGQFAERKTKAVVAALKAFGVAEGEKALLVVKDDENVDLFLSGRNVAKLTFNIADRLDIYEVLKADKILIEEPAVAFLNERYGADEDEE